MALGVQLDPVNDPSYTSAAGMYGYSGDGVTFRKGPVPPNLWASQLPDNARI